MKVEEGEVYIIRDWRLLHEIMSWNSKDLDITHSKEKIHMLNFL
jgi:hypothetical protein